MYWDYLFLIRPERPSLPGWLQVFEQVFPEDRAPPAGVMYGKGEIIVHGLAGAKYPFVAAALIDPVRRDFVGRPVQHFFIYLLEEADLLESFHDGWAEGLLSALGPSMDPIFSEQRGEVDPVEFSTALLRRIRDLIPERIECEVSGDPVSWTAVGDIVLGKQVTDEKKTLGPTQKRVGPIQPWVLVTLVLIGLLLWLMRCHHPAQQSLRDEPSASSAPSPG